MNFKERLYDGFEKMLNHRIALGFSRGHDYRCIIPHFIDHCVAMAGDSMYISREMVNSYLATCPDTNGTARKVSLIREYTKYLRFIGGKDFVPDDDYSFKHQSFIPFLFTDQELKSVISELDSFRGQAKISNLEPEYILPVYSRLLYCCGLRPSEVLLLKVEDFNFKTGELYIRQSKKNRDRHIIMSDDMLDLCRVYNTLAGERTWFFEKRNGEHFNIQWFYDWFNKACIRAGITRGKPRPYDLRHAFASRNITRWMEEGKDAMALLPYLAEYMGHADISSTMYYIHLIPDHLRKHLDVDDSSLKRIYGKK